MHYVDVLNQEYYSEFSVSLSVTAAYPAAYAPISQAFPQQPAIIPQQQREGECDSAPSG